MALINCPECASQVSSSVYKCPSCGTQLRKVRRGFFGSIFKWGFILFHFFMLAWLIGGISAATEGYETLSEAEQVGSSIGMGIGVTVILGVWFFGSVVLGLFVLLTRPRER